VPLVDAMQVLTYAKYLKDMLNKKKPIPRAEMVKLTEQCSAAILNQLPKNQGPRESNNFLLNWDPSNLIKHFVISELASVSSLGSV